MKKFILAALMVVGMAGMAHAQSIGLGDGKSYVTGSVGSSVIHDGKKTDQTDYSVAFGREFSSLFRGELAYDYLDKHGRKGAGQSVVANGIVQYQVPGTIFTPYLLAGAGYGWQAYGDEAVYNVGGGLRAELTKSVDLDLRAKRVSNLRWGNFNDTSFHTDVLTAGVSYKF